MKMKRPRPVYVYVEKKRLTRAKKSSSGEGAPRSRSNTPIGSSGQEKRKAAKTKPDEPMKKSSLRVFSSNAFGEMSATKRPTTSLHHHHPTSKNRRPSDWSSGRGYGESSDTQGRRSGKGSSRGDSKRDDHYRYSNDNNLLNNFEICSSSRSDTQRRHHRKRKNYTITLCFDLPTNSSSHQLLPPPPPPPPPPPQPLPIRPVGSAAFSQCMSMSAPFAANQTNMSDYLSAYGGYIGNNMSSAFGQYSPNNCNNGQTGYNCQQPQQNTLGLYGSPMQYGTQAAPNFMNPTPQFSNIGSYGSNNFANNNMSNMNNYGYGMGYGGDNSSSLNNYGFGYDPAAYSAAAAAISAAASTPVASAPFTPAATNTSNAFATSAALANENPASKLRENYFSKTSHGYNCYNSGYPPVSQPPIYSQFTSSNYFNNNYLGSLDNLKAQNTYANPYNSGNYGGQQYCNYPYNYNSSPSYGYNYRASSNANQVPVSASFSAALTTPTPQYQYNEVYSVPYGTGANFVNELIHRSLQNNQQCFGYNSAAFLSPSPSSSFNCLCLCFPENFRRPPNAFYHRFKRPPINTRYYHHRRTHHRSGLYDFSDSDYINNLIC